MQPPSLYSENELVRLVKSRDKEAFKYLYEKYNGALYSIISQILPGTNNASDLLQDAFITIWSRIDAYDPAKGRLFTWMLAITRNLCIDVMRSKSYKNEQKNIYLGNDFDEELFAAGKTATMPETVNYIGLKKAVQKLPPKQRQLINLAYFSGYTQSEIAGMEGVPKGTVKTRIRKALIELRQHLQ